MLKEIHKEMNVESVEKLLGESQEAQAYQRVRFLVHHLFYLTNPFIQEIDEMLANQLTLDDEDAVQAELLALQGEAVSRSAMYITISDRAFRNTKANLFILSNFHQFLHQILLYFYPMVSESKIASV